MSQARPSLSALLEGPERRAKLAQQLLEFARTRRWYRAKSRTAQTAWITDVIPLDAGELDRASELLAVLEIRYAQGDPETYALALVFLDGADADALAAKNPSALIARPARSGTAALADGLGTGSAAELLFRIMAAGASRPGEAGELRGEASPALAELLRQGIPPVEVPRVEQTNSTLLFGDRAILKIYRRLTAGPNPELELGRFLGACVPRPVPRVLGALSYRPADGGPPRSLGIAHEFLSNDGDAWSLAQGELADYFARVSGDPPVGLEAAFAGGSALLAAARRTPATGGLDLGRFLVFAEILGRRTGELHLALASDGRDPDFAPEPLTPADRGGLVERAEDMLGRTLVALDGARHGRLGTEAQGLAERLLAPGGKRRIVGLLRTFRDRPLDAVKTRTHGDLHLGQVLVRRSDGSRSDNGNGAAAAEVDFVIVDFEGEPARPLEERRAKSSPLRDVMGMIRSFDYAAAAALRGGGALRDPPRQRALAGWGKLWTGEVTAAFLRAYLRTVGAAPFIPAAPEELPRLITFHGLEKVIYEIGYELDNRPEWVEIPLRGLVAIIESEAARGAAAAK